MQNVKKVEQFSLKQKRRCRREREKEHGMVCEGTLYCLQFTLYTGMCCSGVVTNEEIDGTACMNAGGAIR